MDPKLVLKTCVFCVLFVMTLGMYMIFKLMYIVYSMLSITSVKPSLTQSIFV